MPARSAIDQLPPELREWLQAELIARGFSGYSELETALNAKLAELGIRISRSSLHRFGQDVEARLARLRDTTNLARTIAHEVGDDEGAMTDALTRLIQDRLFGIVAEMDDMEAKDVAKIGHVVADLARASVSGKKYMAAVRAKAEAAEKAVTETVKEAGLSEEAVQIIRKQILGIAA